MNQYLSWNNLRWILLWAGLVFIYTLLRWHTFFCQLVHDDGLFLYGGQALADGQLPYRDFWDHKPPALFAYHSLPLLFSPFSLIAVKFHQILWLALGATFLFSICRKFFSLFPSLAVILLYAFFTSHPETIQSGGLTEESALAFVIIAYWIALQEKWPANLRFLLSGIFMGVAVQFRQTFVFESLFLLVYLFSAFGFRDIRKTFRTIVCLAAGMVLPEIILSAFFFLCGNWFFYFEASYLSNFYYIGAGGPSRTLSEIWSMQWDFIEKTGPFLLAPILAIPALFGIHKTNRWLLVALLFTFVGDAFCISLSGEYYNHYYVQSSVTTVLLLGFFLEGVFQGIQKFKLQYLMIPSIILSATAIIFLVIPLAWGIQGYWSGLKPSIHIYKSESPSGSGVQGYEFQQTVAQAVNSITAPDDLILLIGRQPNSVYFLSERYAGSRYYHFSPLWKAKFEGKYMERHREYFFQDLTTKKPTLLLIDLYRLRGGPLSRIEKNTPNALNYIEENYTPLHDAIESDLGRNWSWYDINLIFWVRKDQQKDVISRYNQIVKNNN